MKNLTLLLVVAVCYGATSQDTKSVLLKQMKSTHNENNWFVSINIAIAGLTAEQANWKDDSGNHSIAQLTSHIVFWNERELNKFKDIKPGAYNGNNDETFDTFTQGSWDELVMKADAVMKGWEEAIQAADEKKLKGAYETIANISTHNAYHTGQIVFARKQQGVWDPKKGVN